jgi:CheY-like chemotaxis protein
MNSKINVLLVDNAAAMHTNTQQVLEQEGFSVARAATCEDALERIHEREPDVVVMDLDDNEYGAHGANATLECIRQNHPMVAVIMLTEQAQATHVIDAACEGAFDYLAKPCDMPYLISRIHDAYSAVTGGLSWMGEKQAADLMIPLHEYKTVSRGTNLRDAFRKALENRPEDPRDHDPHCGIRSLLVLDEDRRILGYITYRELLEAVNKAHGTKQRPVSEDTVKWEKYFWRGVFTRQLGGVLGTCVEDVMATYEATVDAGSSLQEVADAMFTKQLRRVLVKEHGRCVGIIRDHELYAEIEEIFLHSHAN